jgi:DNA-binding MarR family transcriptional regulator
MPETKGLHDIFRPGGALAVLEPSHDPSLPPSGAADVAFPREQDIRLAQDLLFFAYRDFTNAADVILEELGLGRAHHRALHFIGRNPGITVSELLAILRITKQSLARVLGALVDQGYVAQAQGNQDRRQRLLTLTRAGQALERRLFERQHARLAVAYREAGAAAVAGFRSVMQGIMDEEACRNIAETYGTAPLVEVSMGAVGLGEAPTGAVGFGEAPTGAVGLGEAPMDAMGLGKTPRGAMGFGDSPAGAVRPGETLSGAVGLGEAPTGPVGLDAAPTAAGGLGEAPRGALGDSPAGAIRPGESTAGAVRPGGSTAGMAPPGDTPAAAVRLADSPPGAAGQAQVERR